jgi:hypothetical protein
VVAALLLSDLEPMPCRRSLSDCQSEGVGIEPGTRATTWLARHGLAAGMLLLSPPSVRAMASALATPSVTAVTQWLASSQLLACSSIAFTDDARSAGGAK